MKLILKVLLTAVAVVILAYILPGVSVDGYVSAIIVAVVLGILRLIVKAGFSDLNTSGYHYYTRLISANH
jgi:Membrane protein of unknown function.